MRKWFGPSRCQLSLPLSYHIRCCQLLLSSKNHCYMQHSSTAFLPFHHRKWHYIPADCNLIWFELGVVMAVMITVFQDVMYCNIININITEEPVSTVRAPWIHHITSRKALILMTVILLFYCVNKMCGFRVCQKTVLFCPVCLLYTSAWS